MKLTGTEGKTLEDAEPSSFLPEFCNIGTLFGVVLLAELIAFVLVLSSHPLSALLDELGLVSLFVQWIALGSAGVLCSLHKSLGRLSHTQAGVFSFAVVLVTTFLVTEATFWIVKTLQIGHTLGDHWEFLARNLIIAAIVGAITLRFFYLQFLQRVHLEAESSARIQALQARIRPHFLFNSMNTIAALIRVRPDQAETAVEDLSDLFRASLGDAQQRVPLASELECARRYLEIEKLRLGDRLTVEWELKDLPEQARVPSLILQPLLENSIYHGIENLVQGGTVRIRGQYQHGLVTIAITNPIPNRSKNSAREGHQIAVRNIQERLNYAFGKVAGLQLSQLDNCFQVELRFPA